MTNDLKNFLEEIERVFDTNLQLNNPPHVYESLKKIVIDHHNNVLDLVEKEVEKKKQYGDTKDAYEFVLSTKDISTIINNLRV